MPPKLNPRKSASPPSGSTAAPAATCPSSTWTSACSIWPALIELVYSPLVDIKEFPRAVDVTLVEGSVSTDEDIEKIRKIRKHTKILIALGDCAVTGNVPAMRNPFGTRPCSTAPTTKTPRSRSRTPQASADAAGTRASGARSGEG
jgi:coenzyme F420-reducing hydrogenase gamma subunit